MFGVAMFAIVMSVSLASCSKENPEGNEDFSNEKKLVKIVSKDENGKDLEVFTFEYDNKGKLTKSTGSIDHGEFTKTNNYT